MRKGNRLATALSLIAIALSVFVLLLHLQSRPESTVPQTAESQAQTAEAQAQTAESQAQEDRPGGQQADETQTMSSAEQVSDGQAAAEVTEDGQYETAEEVALYIHLYGHLPSNYITKAEAKKLGWQSAGELDEVAPGMCIGGDRFNNYEGLLPEDARYTECDVNYRGGRRGAERIVFSDDGAVYYTADHYESFTQLY